MIILIVLGISSISILSFYILPARGVTWIEGHIASDTTWTPADTYRVINDTYVDPGVTLTILAGVHVQFGDGFSLIVQGSLNATGTEAEPIVFTSTRITPTSGVWNTMKFAGNETEFLTLKHARVEYGTCGVTVQSTGKTILEKNGIYNCSDSGIHILSEGTLNGTLSIRENTIEHNHNGISSARVTIYTTAAQSDILIENNSICNNENLGIYLHSSVYGQGRIENVTVLNNIVSFNGEDGINIYSRSSYGNANHLNNVTVSNNSISNNGGNGIFLTSQSGPRTGLLYDVNVSNNTISNNDGNGIYLLSSGFGASLYNVTVLGNTVSFSKGDGVLLRSSDHYSLDGGELFNVTVSNNTLLINSEAGIHAAGQRQDNQDFDLLIHSNVLSANRYGCKVDGTTRTHLLWNSISFGTHGVFFTTTNENMADHNDIYQNSYGMNVTNGATVNAELNYWGSSTGPYHGLNLEGKGNPVNGDGTDLEFIPFLASPMGIINERPVAMLEVNNTNPMLNESVTFDGINSTDEGRVDCYFFDFGDGTDSGWTTLPMVIHKYAEGGKFDATLIVMDDFGVTSLDGYLVHVEITVAQESPLPPILPLLVIATSLAAITLLAVLIYRRKHSADRQIDQN